MSSSRSTAETAPAPTGAAPATTVLHVGGLHYASEKAIVDGVLAHRCGVLEVDANPVAQTATVTFDPEVTSVAELRQWIQECGYHCAGQSLPGHVCDPLVEAGDGGPNDFAATERAEHAHGHGEGGHAGMSMVAMARDMRNRFLVALIFTVPTVLWSTVGTELLGSEIATPLGLDRDVWLLVLSLPIVLYASSIFFTGAVAALRARTLDMMVLVAVAIGTAWIYSVAATFFIAGDVFYEAAGMLATFVLLGHWFEMRARGGANDAIRTLLDLAPAKALVLRDGEPVEVPTAEVVVGDLLLIRPGAKLPVDAIVEEGESQVDESTVTGESLPVGKGPGDKLIGATINKNGTLRARASAVGRSRARSSLTVLRICWRRIRTATFRFAIGADIRRTFRSHLALSGFEEAQIAIGLLSRAKRGWKPTRPTATCTRQTRTRPGSTTTSSTLSSSEAAPPIRLTRDL